MSMCNKRKFCKGNRLCTIHNPNPNLLALSLIAFKTLFAFAFCVHAQFELYQIGLERASSLPFSLETIINPHTPNTSQSLHPPMSTGLSDITPLASLKVDDKVHDLKVCGRLVEVLLWPFQCSDNSKTSGKDSPDIDNNLGPAILSPVLPPAPIDMSDNLSAPPLDRQSTSPSSIRSDQFSSSAHYSVAFTIRDFTAEVERKVVLVAPALHLLPTPNFWDAIVLDNTSYLHIGRFGDAIFAATQTGSSWTIIPFL
ncbi:hypothetical protein EDD21DRAFT_356681 [Dissophora ornata]|nr:hypothetical protein EDD21DRAFT_356681 [Dissophora ornata]